MTGGEAACARQLDAFGMRPGLAIVGRPADPDRQRGQVRWGWSRLTLGRRRIAVAPATVACLGNPDPVGMKVYCPTGKETFDDEKTEEAPPRRDRGEAA
jgi:hypothetical protein